MPASFVVFDVLALDGTDIRSRPYAARRAMLEDLLARRLPHGLVLMPMSTEFAVARAWLLNHSDAGVEGVEGVVAKRRDHPYRVGGRMWRKVRTRFTEEAVVGGVLGTLARPEALIVGRPDRRGRLRGCRPDHPVVPRCPRRRRLGSLVPARSRRLPDRDRAGHRDARGRVRRPASPPRHLTHPQARRNPARTALDVRGARPPPSAPRAPHLSHEPTRLGQRVRCPTEYERVHAVHHRQSSLSKVHGFVRVREGRGHAAVCAIEIRASARGQPSWPRRSGRCGRTQRVPHARARDRARAYPPVSRGGPGSTSGAIAHVADR